MAKDWRKPFLELKSELRPLYDAGLGIHHAVMMSANMTAAELDPVIAKLEPAYREKNLIRTILANTEGCTYHGHLFFARDRTGLDQIGRLLDGIEGWMDDIPGGFVPAFSIPPDVNQAHRNILRWVSTVYYLADTSDASYLDLEVEYQEAAMNASFLPWTECPQPPGCRPLDWLIHRSSQASRLQTVLSKFTERGERFPDVVDAYLTGEFIAASMAAIDILAYVMHGERKERKQRSLASEDFAKSLAANTHGRSKVAKEAESLRMFLLYYHDPAENTDIEVNPEMPMTQDGIGRRINWEGNPLTVRSKVHRSMKALFGDPPMAKYREALRRGMRNRPDGASLLYYPLVEPRPRG